MDTHESEGPLEREMRYCTFLMQNYAKERVNHIIRKWKISINKWKTPTN